ncbi:Protein ABHD1 [Seminavis robusta]|uniref:Protein ABHD1 n=1 Tax=Seminavis robusta TaxID=568900 RepID=A0A9N8DAM8_9STRA|nr:Protein ABHD1 [Seminavis robusta]|eukprot:Sro17_g012020.1 Protein ABHD1 (347) ;mRNA; f:4550-5590
MLLASLASEPDKHGSFWDHRQRIKTSNNDFFHVDYKYHSRDGTTSSKGLVVIVHGLQSNSNSSLSVDMGRAYIRQGFDCACINFRGCSGVPNAGLRAYHLGFTDDLKQYLSLLNSGVEKPPPIFVSGFSLGANVVLKAWGELGMSAYEDYNVYGAAVCGAPFENERNVNCVQKAGFNKLVYNGSLLKSLKTTALNQLERYPDSEEAQLLCYDEIANSEEISAFENAVIAPLFGFEDNIDYYRKTDCVQFLDRIRVPTIVINAADDPFFDPNFFPFDKGCTSKEGREKRSAVRLVRTKYGGHLGYMFHQREDDTREQEGRDEVSFMPGELSRFIQHVWERRTSLMKR